MKKVYFIIFSIVSFLCYCQSYSSLLKNADWTIMKIQNNGIEYLPPFPFVQSGKADFKYDNTNGFKSSFYNSAVGTVDFAPNNGTYFNSQIAGITLAEYGGENSQQVNQFDLMTTSFYSGFNPTDQFIFEYEEIFSAKNLTVTNPLGNKIFYSNLILESIEVSLNKEIFLYPNPAKNEFFLKSSNKDLGKVSVEIYDQSGKLVSRQKRSFKNPVRIGSLPSGVYFVKISGSDFNYSSQLIVTK
ncbi:T9SS type A sorting domain-containing protein [Kaistella antarctica]|uniref:Por secretion system C-terminal sorting domain n=1 Tax=Kaistella antarctica TaxID=266748 RepID=A0A3S4WP36_9FLAO|nr:T9SS type A sorting domain-containing protein [Kaistella antarctica]KEY19917.1 hypothetical protein HY04_01460 [Kaistella antarctica]SEV95923.1 Por secretion system C-terminal sorting domain-containing protein [Kaistella antarctica]VEH96100.1 Por secretion system C-terminal sorting domain [Kaistella antarctica]